MSALIKKLAPLAAFACAMLLPVAAFAQEKAAAGGSDPKFGAYLGAGLAMGLAVLGGGLGQGRASASALEGIARNPSAQSKIQTPMLIALALIESLVLFALLVAYLLQSK
ncbi:MAG TPA: ATP synthase F0 subunit C [Polyangiaceae bacterium]|nr:ATP synthase F0 subunit C [Polyangiaceae bacterium]